MSVKLERLREMRAFIDAEITIELHRIAELDRLQRKELRDAAELYGVTVEEIRGGSRRAEVVRARMAAAWLLHRSGESLREIARVIGYSDHAVARHAVRKINNSPGTRALLRELEAAA